MHDTDTNIPLEQLRIYEGDKLIFDGSDTSTYTVWSRRTARGRLRRRGRGRAMSLPGETISHGAAPRCDDCGRMSKLDVYLSGAGYYIGTYCACGPYTRESGYYRTRELAQAHLDSRTYGR